MARLSAWQRTWMTAAIGVWVLCVTLSGLQAALWGWGSLGWVFSHPEPDAYPEVRLIRNIEFTPPEDAFRPGDRIVSVDDHDLRGLAGWRVAERLYPAGTGKLWEWSRYRDAARVSQTRTFRYLRDGERRSVAGTYGVDPYNGLVWLVSFFASGLIVFVGLRARDSRAARAFLLVGLAFGFMTCRFYFGSAALFFARMVISAIGACVMGSFFLRWALLMPEEAAPQGRWPYWAVWLPLPVAASQFVVWLTGGAFGYLEERRVAGNLTAVVVVVLGVLILIRNYWISGPLGRRQLKWVLLAVSLESIWLAAWWIVLAWRPDLGLAIAPFVLPAWLVIPVGIAIATLRFNLFDIDRLLSATAALGIAAAMLLVVAALAIPYAGATVNNAFGVADPTGQLIVAVALVALVLPSQRFVRPWVDRTFFKERVALLEGLDATVTELMALDSRRDLLCGLGEQLERLLHPESLVVYAGGGGSFSPVFSAGSSPGEIGHERVLVEALMERSSPLARMRGGARRTEPASPFDQAALETLGAEVVLPLRRGRSLDAFVCLGRKRSGDVYTATDLALLGSLADKASLKLGEFEEEPAEERHLAAIVSADVVGYSRLMSLDEQGTIHTLSARRDLVERLAREHHGRVVDFVGDSFLAEFPSALDAAGCALRIQQSVEEGNRALPPERRMEFRLGVHLGDVTARGQHIYGDGVNIAARLEALAEPGGVCISATVHEQVEGKLRATHEDLGEQQVKNIPRPVRVYRLRV